jgi:hypothetical protein
MRHKVMRVVVLALPVVGATAAVVINFGRIGWPNVQFWSDRQWLVVLGIVLAGLIPAIQTGISELGARRRTKELEQGDDVRSLLTTSLVLIARECNAPLEQIGVQAFLVTGVLWRKRQVRIAKIRLSSVAASGVAWTKGKGVIGRCWETRTSQWAQLDDPPFSELGRAPETTWHMLNKTLTYGLSFDDYRALGTKYGTVAAVPIMTADDKYIGCIALDTPAGIRLDRSEIALESLAATADVVRRLLGR